jgi:hypothetical protein
MVVTIFGVCALAFMMAMYALERRHRRFILAFVVGCLLSSAYGFLSGAWPFGVVELVWAAIAFRRYQTAQPARRDRLADHGDHNRTGASRHGR